MELTTSLGPVSLQPYRPDDGASGAAPAAQSAESAAGEGSASPEERPKATSRPLWLMLFGLLAVITALRIPAIYETIRTRLPKEISEGIGDAEMQSLALKVGAILAVVSYLFAIAIYFSLAAILEKRIFRVGIPVGRGRTAGLFFLVALLSTLVPQLSSLISDQAQPAKGPVYVTYFVLVAILAPLAFHSTLKTLSKGRLALLYLLVGLMVALVSVA